MYIANITNPIDHEVIKNLRNAAKEKFDFAWVYMSDMTWRRGQYADVNFSVGNVIREKMRVENIKRKNEHA